MTTTQLTLTPTIRRGPLTEVHPRPDDPRVTCTTPLTCAQDTMIATCPKCGIRFEMVPHGGGWVLKLANGGRDE